MAPQSVLTLVDVAKASTIAYNEKNFDKIRSLLAPNAVYDEVGTGRRLEGVNEIVNAFKGLGEMMPDQLWDIVHYVQTFRQRKRPVMVVEQQTTSPEPAKGGGDGQE